MTKEKELVMWGWASKGWIPNQWMRYKLTYEGWKKLWEAQNGRCAGCGEEFAHPKEREVKYGVKPETDHEHVEGRACETQDVRGLLCRRCNDFLGKIRDNKDILANLLAYLKRHGEL